MLFRSLAVIIEEVAAGDGGTSTVVSVNNCPVCSILMAWAGDAQKEEWLKPLARGDMLGAFCLTEPHVGSEAGGLKTTAVKEGDDYAKDMARAPRAPKSCAMSTLASTIENLSPSSDTQEPGRQLSYQRWQVYAVRTPVRFYCEASG